MACFDHEHGNWTKYGNESVWICSHFILSKKQKTALKFGTYTNKKLTTTLAVLVPHLTTNWRIRLDCCCTSLKLRSFLKVELHAVARGFSWVPEPSPRPHFIVAYDVINDGWNFSRHWVEVHKVGQVTSNDLSYSNLFVSFLQWPLSDAHSFPKASQWKCKKFTFMGFVAASRNLFAMLPHDEVQYPESKSINSSRWPHGYYSRTFFLLRPLRSISTASTPAIETHCTLPVPRSWLEPDSLSVPRQRSSLLWHARPVDWRSGPNQPIRSD